MKAEVEKLFHELADRSPEARTRYFAEHEVDADLRREVDALLAFDSASSGFLANNIRAAAARALSRLEAQGLRCGPYRLLQLIGRGGMGAVYLAERVDGEVAQRVAVKVLPPGVADSQRERFLQERQILAALTHPNVAHIVDVGRLDNGQPFLVMEYVDGKPIDLFAAGLGVRRKIALFLKVCAAVGYLHRNLVVHRDLKPGNILVTAEGEPKLLDFGIAKILDLATDLTIPGTRMLTPDFASPEQATGGSVSTATDIYSLGAVLYQLLTGSPAHEFADDSVEGISTVIATREVMRPSRRAPALKGDLDYILLKALRKNPQDRYATAEQLGEDLQAHLDSRPVRARSGNAWYHARKFARRHRTPVAAAMLVVAGLTTGLTVAVRQRAVAERRFLQAREVANRFMAFDDEIRELYGTTNLRNRIVSTSLGYLAEVGKDVRGDRELSLEMAAAYLQIARIQGVPVHAHLGRFAQAEESLRKADEFVGPVLAADRGNRRALLTSARISHDRLILAIWKGRPTDALAEADRIGEQIDRLRSHGSLNANEAAEADSLLRAAEFARQYGSAAPGARNAERGPRDLKVAWGSNRYGELGNGGGADTAAPAPTTELAGVAALAVSAHHNVALRTDGTVWTWGQNSDGQLGIASTADRSTPAMVPTLRGAVAVGAGGHHSLAVLADGSVWAWGQNSRGQLGNRTKAGSDVPVRVPGLSQVRAVACGDSYSVALRSDGTVWTWGTNRYGQLGIGSDADQDAPHLVPGLKKAIAIAAGPVHTLAITSDGAVWAWGSNQEGALGAGTYEIGYVPALVPGLRHVVAVGAGWESSLALTADGEVWAWGLKDTDPEGGSDKPVRLAGLSNVASIAISSANHEWPCYLAARRDGTVWVWGMRNSGQSSDGANAYSRAPVLVPGLLGVVGVAAGGYHNLALTGPTGGLTATVRRP